MANCPSREEASRGVVAIQLGFPRPALRNADCVVREVSPGQLDQLVLISNGLGVSKSRASVHVSLLSQGSIRPGA
jgi:hypothetical protein